MLHWVKTIEQIVSPPLSKALEIKIESAMGEKSLKFDKVVVYVRACAGQLLLWS